MSQSRKPVKKGYTDFVCSKSHHTLYTVAETENVGLDLFVVQYLSPEEIISTIALYVLLAS